MMSNQNKTEKQEMKWQHMSTGAAKSAATNPMIRIERCANGECAIDAVFPLNVAALAYQSHLPLVNGMSQAQWLAKELSENHNTYETGHGCAFGETIRFVML